MQSPYIPRKLSTWYIYSKQSLCIPCKFTSVDQVHRHLKLALHLPCGNPKIHRKCEHARRPRLGEDCLAQEPRLQLLHKASALFITLYMYNTHVCAMEGKRPSCPASLSWSWWAWPPVFGISGATWSDGRNHCFIAISETFLVIQISGKKNQTIFRLVFRKDLKRFLESDWGLFLLFFRISSQISNF